MSEKDDAIALANKVLDTPNRDPDDDLSSMSRQFLRALEREATLLSALEEAQAVRAPEPDFDTAWHWIDRYASGIDGEPRMSRIYHALTGSWPFSAAALTPGDKP